MPVGGRSSDGGDIMAKYGCERYPETCDDHHPIGDTDMGDTHKLCDRCETEDKLKARIKELEDKLEGKCP